MPANTTPDVEDPRPVRKRQLVQQEADLRLGVAREYLLQIARRMLVEEGSPRIHGFSQAWTSPGT